MDTLNRKATFMEARDIKTQFIPLYFHSFDWVKFNSTKPTQITHQSFINHNKYTKGILTSFSQQWLILHVGLT